MTTLKQDIKKAEGTPISFEEIQRVLKNHTTCNFVLLDDLRDKPTDHEIFASHDCVAILCTLHSHGVATNINHWVCIIKRKGEYWFFDSLGHDPVSLTARLHNGHKALVNWMSSRKVVSNRVKVQSFQDNVQSCGSHVACRLVQKRMSNKKYIHWLKHGFLGDTDLTVSLLTFFDLIKE